MRIGPVEISGSQPCRTVAEISNSHNGSLDRALRLIRAAKDAGADLVKFQCYTPDELVALRGDGPAPEPWGNQGWTMRRLYEKAQTPLAWFPRLVEECVRIGVPWFSSVFGQASLAVLESLDCPAYKIASLDRMSGGLLAAAEATNKPLLISSPHIYDIGYYRPMRASILYCPPGYPTPLTDICMPEFEEHTGFLGLSSHCLDPVVPVVAVSRGAKLIEMHFQLDDCPSELEASVSLTARQFADMVQAVRRTEEVIRV